MNGAAETHPALTVASSALEQALRLGPDDPFPEELLGLPLEQLQIEFTSRLLG